MGKKEKSDRKIPLGFNITEGFENSYRFLLKAKGMQPALIEAREMQLEAVVSFIDCEQSLY